MDTEGMSESGAKSTRPETRMGRKLCQRKTASPLFVAIAKRFRAAGLQVFEELFAADFVDHSNQRLPEEF